MIIELVVRVNNYPLPEFAASIEAQDVYTRCWEPLKTTDEPIIAFATGEHLAGSKTCNIVNKLRSDASKELAEHISEMIIASMKKHDTHNGYSKGDSDERL